MTTTTSGVGSSRTVSAASGGFFQQHNNLNPTPRTLLQNNPARTSITVHNPGTIDLYFAPLYDQTTGTDTLLVPSVSALGGCFLVFANGGTLVIEGECQKPWQAFSASGSNNPITIQTNNT